LDEVRNHPSVGAVKIKDHKEDSLSFIVDVVRCKACEALIRSKALMVFPVNIYKGRMKWLLITDNNKTITPEAMASPGRPTSRTRIISREV
jgi:hypothetical protein